MKMHESKRKASQLPMLYSPNPLALGTRPVDLSVRGQPGSPDLKRV